MSGCWTRVRQRPADRRVAGPGFRRARWWRWISLRRCCGRRGNGWQNLARGLSLCTPVWRTLKWRRRWMEIFSNAVFHWVPDHRGNVPGAASVRCGREAGWWRSSAEWAICARDLSSGRTRWRSRVSDSGSSCAYVEDGPHFEDVGEHAGAHGGRGLPA